MRVQFVHVFISPHLIHISTQFSSVEQCLVAVADKFFPFFLASVSGDVKIVIVNGQWIR